MFAYCCCSREEVLKGVRRNLQRAFYSFFGERLTHDGFEQIARIAQAVSIRCFDFYCDMVPKEARCDSGVVDVFVCLYASGEYRFLLQKVARKEKPDDFFDYPIVTLLHSTKPEEKGRALDSIAFAAWLYFTAARELLVKYQGPWPKEREDDLETAREDCAYLRDRTRSRRNLEKIIMKKGESTDDINSEIIGRPFIEGILQYMEERVVGQERAKRAVAGSFYKYLRYGERDPLLLIGPTGSGTTFLIRCAIDYLKETYSRKIHFFYKNISRVTPEGWSGEDPSEALALFEEVKSNEYYIVQLDEIDKIMHPSTNHVGEDVHRELQEQIMNVLDGSDCLGNVKWSHVLIICTGAFGRLDAIRRERMLRAFPELEFTGMVVGRKPQYDIREFLIAGGVSPEMIGRFSQIERLNKLRKEDIRRILLLQNGPLSTIRTSYAREGIRLEVDDDGIEAIVDRIVEQDLGARSCSNVLNTLVGSQKLVEAILNEYKIVQVDGQCRVTMKRKRS